MKPAGPAASRIDVASVIAFPPSYDPGAARAEARALFFLAGWCEHPTPGLEPYLVCIDTPPASVEWLAERAGARLIYCPPFVCEDGQPFDRARAWAPPTADAGENRRLVLDPEVLIVGNPVAALAALPAGTLLAAAPAAKPGLADTVWSAIYHAVGLPVPAERMPSLRATLGLPVGGQGGTMPPYYHPAAILTPPGVMLGELWARHLVRLVAVWPTLAGLTAGQRADASKLERAALTTALAAWQASPAANGIVCQPLPQAWAGRRVCLEAGVPLRALPFIHVPGLFGELTDLAQIGLFLEATVALWRTKLNGSAARRSESTAKTRLWVKWQTRRLESALRRLYQRHVRPALRMGGEIA